MCRTNGNPNLIGKSAIVTIDLPYIYESHLFKIRVNERLTNASTVVAFLNTKYGRVEIEKQSMVGNQANFSIAKFKELKIPKFKETLLKNIESTIYKSYYCLNHSKSQYLEAEALLLDTLGLRDFEPSNEPVNVKNFSESFLASGRLDAEYYQRKYEEIENALKRNSNGFTFVKKEFGLSKDIIDKTEKTYNYTEISDVNTSDGTVSYNEIEVTELPDNGKMKLKKGQLIISKVRPYRGAVAIIRDEPKNYVGSGAFTVLEEKGNIKKEVLQVLLRTKPCQELIMKYNVGSSYPVVKDEDILNLAIPNIDKDIQQQIAEKIEESFRLKRESERLLDLAKRAVEVAIEEGEEAGVEMMSSFAKASEGGE
jgi:type I restriction enzyme, S subunit